MTIVVVGAGAIGLLVAGQLASAGQRTILLARPGMAQALAQQPLRISEAGAAPKVAQLITIADPAALLPSDMAPALAILCVKGYDTAAALPALATLNAQAILTLQNGLGNEEQLAERFGAARIISGAITSSVEISAPGQIALVKRGGIGLAPFSPAAQPATDHAAHALRSAGFALRVVADYRALKWSKVLLNMLGNATAAILDLPVDAVYANARLIALERRAFLEALAVMSQRGIAPVNLPRYPAAQLATAMRALPAMLLNPLLRRQLARGRGGKPPSLQLDLARGNQRSEGAFLYGAIAQAADQSGVAAPVNHALWDILHAIATGTDSWAHYRHQPERLLAAVERH